MDAPPRRPGLSADKLALLQRRVGAAAHRADRAGAIPRRAGDAPARLSFAQRRLWFLDQLAPNNPFYNIACAVRLRTFLNVAALRAALAVMVRRHEALRTTFTVLDGEPRQVVAPTMAVELPVSDLRHLPIGDREDEAVRLATEEARQPFDLARGPLMRARLLTLGDQDFLFVLCMHHIVSDGWSMGVFIREFNAVYAGLMAGRPAQLPPMPIQYADFAEWQRGWLTAERLAAHVEHWRQRLEDLPTLSLPTDRPRPKTKSYRGALHAFTVPAATCLHLRALCEATGATPFMALAAAFAALLRRYSGQDDIVIGAPIANRNHADIEGLIGFFVNSVVLRMDTGGDAGLRELTERTKQVTLAAYQHQDVPFETLVEALQPERDTGRNPLFQVTFQLLNTPGAGEPQAAALNTVQLDRRTAIFDIAFTLMEQGETLVGGFEYSTDLFNADTMARMAEHFVLLLDGALREPDRPIGQLPLLTGAEHRLLAQWNDTAVDFPADDLLHRMFEARVAMAPDAVAVRDAQGEISYGELDRRANRLARHLHAHGPHREVPVGVCLPRSIDLVVALLAVLKRGAAYVPIAPDEPAGRIATMVERAGIGLLLTRSDLQARLPANAPPCVLLDAHRDRIDAWPDAATTFDCDPESPAYLLFTSGTTGRPQAVRVPHRAVCNHMRWMQQAFPLTAQDRVLQRTPVSFDASVWEFHAPLLAGALLVMHDPEPGFDPAALARAIARHRIGTVQLVPSLLRLLLQEPAFAGSHSLRRVFCGGEALTPDLVERFQSRLDATLINLYGPTEACIDATFWVVPERSGDASVPPVPIGRPIANTTLHVEDQGVPVPVGVAGELVIGGRGVALGYAGEPELTQRKFMPDPHAPGGLRYRTGDRVRWRADGVMEFLGRCDQQIKWHGVRIEPEEIETLLRAHAAVAQALVLVRRDSAGIDQLVAHVTLHDAAAGSEPQVDAWQRVYDDVIYRDLARSPVALPEFIGWNSSYTGLPLPLDEMNDWREGTLARLRALQPRRVLELGCGTGLLLLALAPECEHCCGTDFSGAALEHLAAQVKARGLDTRVRLLQRRANEVADLADGGYDLVVLNSVAQYFPSADYLVDVLAQAVAAVRPGGSVFVGDLRSLPLLEAFHASLELAASTDGDTAEAMVARVAARGRREEELCVDAAFFDVLRRRVPRISHVSVQPKDGGCDNELSRFRFDVTLHIEAQAPHAPSRAIDWDAGAHDAQAVQAWLRERPATLHLRGMPNPRVTPALRWLRALQDADPGEAVASLRQRVGIDSGAITMAQLASAANADGYRCTFHANTASPSERFDALLSAPHADGPVSPAFEALGEPRDSFTGLTNVPSHAATASRVVDELRGHLRTHLPDRMVPGAIVVLDRFPLTRNGKIDRRALPEWEAMKAPRRSAFIAPRDGIESALAELWRQLLGVARVSADDSFFDLGGHSLLAAQLASRIRERFQVDMPLRAVFESPTVSALAQALVALGARGPAADIDDESIDALVARVARLPTDALQHLLEP